jgi:DNA-binding LytR/AlgR family response regulator
MRILIVEDEELAAERVRTLLKKYDPELVILEVLDTVSSTVSFLRSSSEHIDLILLDIQLADGKSFEIFQQISVDIPIIFTTAYDEYALEAFRVNSIDYLLKPIQQDELERAITKLIRVRSNGSGKPVIDIELARQFLQKKTYKQRFLVKSGERMHFRNASEIAYFHAVDKFCYLVTRESGKKYLVDFTLEQLDKLLDPTTFFRINRSVLLHVDEIREIRKYQGNRLKILTHTDSREDMIVSRPKVPLFYSWLEK